MYPNRNYIILNVNEIQKIDFSQILETSPETLRLSVDGTKTFIKWEAVQSFAQSTAPANDPSAVESGTMTVTLQSTPTFISDLTTAEGPYTHEEILEILASNFWSAPQI